MLGPPLQPRLGGMGHQEPNRQTTRGLVYTQPGHQPRAYRELGLTIPDRCPMLTLTETRDCLPSR